MEKKLISVEQAAYKKFGLQNVDDSNSCKDPRLLDFIYEHVFSAEKIDDEKESNNLDDVKFAIFALPEFKTAAENVALTEDQITRALSVLEGMVKCRLCGSNNTTFTTRQMHSSDEPPTLLVYCASCHHRTTHTGE